MSITQNRQTNGSTPTALESDNARLRDRIKELENEIALERKSVRTFRMNAMIISARSSLGRVRKYLRRNCTDGPLKYRP